jgi:hypothetical protein
MFLINAGSHQRMADKTIPNGQNKLGTVKTTIDGSYVI